MRMLFVHAKYFKYASKKEKPLITIRFGKNGVFLKNVLVVFIAVEKYEENIKLLATKAYEEIVNVLRSIDARCLALCPYTYLSKNEPSITKTVELLKVLEKHMKGQRVPVYRVPHRVEFIIRPYEHSLAESIKIVDIHSSTLSKNIIVHETLSKRLSS